MQMVHKYNFKPYPYNKVQLEPRGQKVLTDGPASNEVPESAIAEHPLLQKPVARKHLEY